MTKCVKSKEQPDFLVDRSRGSLVNTNLNKKLAYKKQRAILRSAQESTLRLNELENSFNAILGKMKNTND